MIGYPIRRNSVYKRNFRK